MITKNFSQLLIKPIAYIHTDFPTKFGIPRQGEVISSLKGKIIFNEDYRKEGILKGIENFSHLWIIWGFSDFKQEKDFYPTIRPPKLGGNTRVGVFASRSPNRPNPLGLTAVKIDEIIYNKKESPIIIVSGIDMMDNTPIYDIKPYIPFADAIFDAKGGYSEMTTKLKKLNVKIDNTLLEKIPIENRKNLVEILSNDPRPGFQYSSKKEYGFKYLDFEIRFKMIDDTTIGVISIEKE